MARRTRSRRGGVDEDPKKPQPETITADSIPAENPVNVPSLGPDPPAGTGTLVAEEGGRRRRASRKTRKSKKQGGRRRKYSRRH